MDKETIAAYTRYAEAYDLETSRFWELFPLGVIDEFTRRAKGKTILELGSGPGRDANILRNKGFEVICVDASPSMVRATRDLGFNSLLMDFENLGFEEASFDGVWAYTSLIHVPKECFSTVLKDIHKVLKEGGVLGLGMLEGHFEGPKESPSMPGASRYFTYYTEAELCDYLVRSRFGVLFMESFSTGRNKYLNLVCQRA